MFTTLEEVREYRSGDRIECLICNKWFGRLTHAHLLTHQLSADEYRSQFGIPWTYSLTSEPSRAATRATVTAQHIANLRLGLRTPGDRMDSRKPPPVVKRHWQEKIRPLGPLVNAQAYVDLPCENCAAPVHTTLLTCVHGVLCKPCAQERHLAKRQLIEMKKAQVICTSPKADLALEKSLPKAA